MTFTRRLAGCAVVSLSVLACAGAGLEGGGSLGVVHSAGVDGQGVDGQGVDGQGVDGQGVDGQGVDGQGIDLAGNKFDSRQFYLHAQKYAGATLNGKPVCLGLYQGALYAVL